MDIKRFCWPVVVIALSGCAVANRLGMPNTPTQGQSEAQVQADKAACTETAVKAGQWALESHRDANRALGAAGIVTGVYLGPAVDPAGEENKAYKACMTSRGYR